MWIYVASQHKKFVMGSLQIEIVHFINSQTQVNVAVYL